MRTLAILTLGLLLTPACGNTTDDDGGGDTSDGDGDGAGTTDTSGGDGAGTTGTSDGDGDGDGADTTETSDGDGDGAGTTGTSGGGDDPFNCTAFCEKGGECEPGGPPVEECLEACMGFYLEECTEAAAALHTCIGALSCDDYSAAGACDMNCCDDALDYPCQTETVALLTCESDC